MFRPGDIVAERYVLGSVLGVGGMGTVYAAVADGSERELAIKLPHTVLARDPYVRRRFCDEAFAGSRIEHRNVVQILEGGDSGGVPYIVMEHVAGCSLSRVALATEPMDVADLVPLFLQVLDGIGEMHRVRIVHGDIKTENVLVSTQRDGTALLKLIDLGLARFVDKRHPAPWDGVLAGTPGYLAPEVFEGGVATYATDQYASAVVLYELLAGKLPTAVQLAEPSAICTRCPALDPVIGRALAHDPAERFDDVRSFAERLRSLFPAQAATPLLATDAPTGRWAVVRPRPAW